MARTIQCDNPNCQATITVPEGSAYVPCPSCGTPHFPSSFGSDSGPGGYDPFPHPHPDPSPNPWPPRHEPEPPPRSPFDEDRPPWLDETHGIPIHREPEPRQQENRPVGFLVRHDRTQLPLKVGTNYIGRLEGDILINDRAVSRKHCIIEVSPKPSGGGWNFIISDIGQQTGKGSTNGVFIDNRSIRLENHERVPIFHGSVIELGTVRLMLQTP